MQQNFDIEAELGTRKCLHTKLFADTHAAIRIELFKRRLSLQEVFEEIATRIANGDPTLTKIIDGIAKDKHERKIKYLRRTDTDSLFDAIDRLSPVSGVDYERDGDDDAT